MRRALDIEAQRLDMLAMRSLRPVDAVRRQAQALNLWALRLASAAQRLVAARAQGLQLSGARFQRAGFTSIQAAVQSLDRLDARLQGLDPAVVLKRGYAWVSDDGGRPLVSASQLRIGQSVRAVLSDGVAVAQVTAVTKTSK
jgi:exodeoxyribonuclease VII large subunit